MHRTDRFFFRPFSRWFPARPLHLQPPAPARGNVQSASALLLAAVVLGAGCTLITDVDRSKIPAAEVVPPPAMIPEEDSDGGAPPSTEGDAGSSSAPDADTDAGADGGSALVGDAG
ncbi:MAG: hypothetical protein RL033_2768 [Pseudomonadota bacterium]|jgi:hypothetical protein